MLLRRLSPPVAATTLLLLLPGCAGADGTDRGAIRENVVEPGITAIGDAEAEACGLDASTLRTAIDAYTLLEGTPPPDEQALVDQGFLRNVTDDWDVVDGRLVAENPACGEVAPPVPIDDIVTDDEPLTVDEVMATFSADDVAAVGGPGCARQLAVLFAGVEAFIVAEGAEPDTLDQVDAAGYFPEPLTAWELVDDSIRPTDGSGCVDIDTEPSVDTEPSG